MDTGTAGPTDGRALWGLSTSPDIVQRVEADAANASVTQDWGFSISQDEDRELRFREDVIRARPVIDAYVAAGRRSVFGGIYMDHASGRLVVQFTAGAAEHEGALSKVFPYPDRLEVAPVTNSEAQLHAAVEAIMQANNELLEQDIRLYTISPDIRSNRVQVGVSSDAATAREAVERLVGPDLVDVFVEVAPAPVDRNNNFPPLKGGLRVTRPLPERPGFIGFCTSAFVTYSTRNALTSTRDYQLLTAGHCGAVGDTYSHGNVPIGRVSKDDYFNAVPGSDAMVIDIAPTMRSNRIYYSPTTTRTITSAQRRRDLTIGQRVDTSGVTTGNLVGQVLELGVTVNYSDDSEGFLRDMAVATNAINDGDSGGPAYSAPQAMGIISGKRTRGADRDLIFSPIERALSGLGVSLLTTAQ